MTARLEQKIQKAVFDHLRSRAMPKVFAFHPANGGYRTPIEAKILKGQGVVSGVPDVIAIMDGKTFALELKTENGTVSDKQIAALQALQFAGAKVSVAYGLNDALHKLEQWGILRGRVT